ncbi:hypothetical protein C2845_PM11G06110 [Panicum miliaceum]|uniref:Uncharacterized protein n=1 Tax=Panicum miliaceum TaxID=4540 RepID=A0A3L6RUL3_PANMI|nr:hypothetical protein C2845_PM11G06110 [Panicum miliaceum]
MLTLWRRTSLFPLLFTGAAIQDLRCHAPASTELQTEEKKALEEGAEALKAAALHFHPRSPGDGRAGMVLLQ